MYVTLSLGAGAYREDSARGPERFEGEEQLRLEMSPIEMEKAPLGESWGGNPTFFDHCSIFQNSKTGPRGVKGILQRNRKLRCIFDNQEAEAYASKAYTQDGPMA